jgi:cytochrome c553
MKKIISIAVLGLTASMAWAGPDAGSPRMNFLLHCSGCHGQDGSGSPSSGVPTMRGTLGHFLKAQDGREFLIQVPGTAQSSLSHAETAELANWLLKTFSPQEVPANTPPYTTAEVARLRGSPLADAPGRRAEIVQRLKEQGIAID